MQEPDLDEADRIMRLAFGTFLGLPEPIRFMGDADYVKTRFRADPPAALIAETDDGRIVGSNFALDWGSVGIFGPLTIDPEYWDSGVAKQLLEDTMKIFENWATKHMGLFTFAQSSKHVHLYQKFGFWPRYLTAVMSKQVVGSEREHESKKFSVGYYSDLDSDKKKVAMEECARLTGEIFSGLDLRKEISSVDKQKLGETILLKDSGQHLAGIAICHYGPETEAGSETCYIKFGAVGPAHASLQNFDSFLDACEQYAKLQKALRLVGGVNMGRHKAYKRMIERGFRTDMQGVAMDRPNDPGYNLPEVYLIDDWR